MSDTQDMEIVEAARGAPNPHTYCVIVEALERERANEAKYVADLGSRNQALYMQAETLLRYVRANIADLEETLAYWDSLEK